MVTFFRSRTIFTATAVSILILSAAVFWIRSDEEEHDAQKGPTVRSVRTILVAGQEGGEVLMQAGTIAPAYEAELSFQVPGKLAKRNVEVGSVVSAGQFLALLDSSELSNELRSAEAQLASAKISSKLADENAARASRLLASQAIAKAQVDVAKAEARAAEENRKAIEAAYHNAKRRLEHASLVATESGVVTAVSANEGEVVTAGQAIIKIAKGAAVDAVFDISEKSLNAAPADIKVQVSLLSDPKVFADGLVREVSPSADPTTRTFRVKAALQVAPGLMPLGAPVIGKALLPGPSEMKIPASAITSKNDHPAVYIVEPGKNNLTRVSVTVKSYTSDYAYVSAGLRSGQRVVIAGVSKLRPGQAVTLEETRHDQ